MKLAILICATFLIGAGFICTATGTQAAETWGPAPDDAGCQAAWTIVSPNGATLSKDQAVPYIIDFTMVDTNKDEAMDADEFKTACLGGYSKFWADVQEGSHPPCPHGSTCQGGICFCNP